VTSDAYSNGPLVLLVEDNERSRVTRSELFRLEGCRVLEVVDVASALAALQDEQVDVVVTDINLSGRESNRDGLTLVRAVRELFGDLPVVAYSAMFAEDEVSAEDRALFDRWYPRGSLDSRSIASSIVQAKELGLAHRRRKR
jgi:CheY-like chemotaxis protein